MEAERELCPSEEELLKAGLQYGHPVRRANPKMAEYVAEERGSNQIFNIAKTRQKLKEAMAFAPKVAASGKRVLFIGTKAAARPTIAEQAQRCGMPYLNEPDPAAGYGVSPGQITSVSKESALGAVLIIEVKEEHEAIMETRKLGIPIIGLTDQADPDDVDYLIPGNDDGFASIRLVCTKIADAILAGKRE